MGDFEQISCLPVTEQQKTQATKAILMWGFPKIGGTFLGVSVIRTIVFGGLYRGPLILGNYPVNIIQAML